MLPAGVFILFSLFSPCRNGEKIKKKGFQEILI
jgi:hypothetical protein